MKNRRGGLTPKKMQIDVRITSAYGASRKKCAYETDKFMLSGA
jgi:hypothetical protein